MFPAIASVETWDFAMQTWAAGLGWPLEGLLRLGLAAVLGS